ncbi:MAG: hypothetical protein ACXW18_03820 [Pyrinomonadaceae bacterium]
MPQFDEEVRCTKGLTVIRDVPTNDNALIVQQGTWTSFFSGAELFVSENNGLRLTLAPNGLFFHHPAGHNTIEIDGINGDIILGNADCAEDFDVRRMSRSSLVVSL